MPTIVPDRGDDPNRKLKFFDRDSNKSHTADVRWVGTKHRKPHAGDVKKNLKNYGPNSGWEVQR